MKFSRSEPGYWLSAAVHAGLLALVLVHFSHEQKFDDAQEAIPVETITENQFSEIMKGEKTAKEATKPRADKVADLAEIKPTPPTPEAKRDVPTPPPPLKRQPDPGEADQIPPTPPTPPERPTPPPPPPVAKTTPPPEAKQEPEKEDAEPVKPPPRPKPPEKVEQKPTPQPPPKPPEKPPEKAVEKPADKPTPKPPKLDEVAKLLAESKDKPASKPKSGDESAPPHQSPDLSEVAKLLSREAPSAKFSTGREVSRTASLGAANATGAKMSPSMSDSLNGLLQEQYKQCWNYLPLTGGQKYVAKIRVSFLPDGSLAGQPTLLNPPSDPSLRGLAESALRAVRRCNPMRIPSQYRPYYDQWKEWVIGFDPEILN